MATKNLNMFGTYLRSSRVTSVKPGTGKKTLLRILSKSGGPILYRDLWRSSYRAGLDEKEFVAGLRDLRRANAVTLTVVGGESANPAVALVPNVEKVVAIL